MSFFGQPPLAALLPLQAGQNLADLPNPATALANLGTLSTSNIMMNSVPMGTIIPYWGSTAPVGYLPCNGQTINSGTFPDLVTFLGGTTSAVVPDLRGEFLRGWDNGRGLDVGRGNLSTQTDALQNITGSYASWNSIGVGQSAAGAFLFSGSGSFPAPTGGTSVGSVTANFDASRVARTSTETRPHNVSVLYCIKAYGAVFNTSTANMGNVLTELSQCTKLSQFGSSLGSPISGYQKLPGGLILQWGYTSSVGATGNNLPITFPIAFPTACLSVSLTPYSAAAGCTASINSAFTQATAVGTLAINGTLTSGMTAQFIAIGY